MKTIIVIGGGFAGLNFVNELENDFNFSITIVDKNNYNFFPPLLYQIATGYLEVSNICLPFRRIFRKTRNVRFHFGEVIRVDLEANTIILTTGSLPYDCLVLATGTETNYFGMENIKANALPMKTLHDAIELRNHILYQMELATLQKASHNEAKLNIVVAGGGPTGVEIAGMLAEMRNVILPKDYPELKALNVTTTIYLVDGGNAVLKPMSASSQKETLRALRAMGIEVLFNMQVKDYFDGKVIFADGQVIKSNTLIWATGVTGIKLEGLPQRCYSRGMRLRTDAYNKVEGINNIYAIGDTCVQYHETNFPNGHPQQAQVAIQQGVCLARNFKALSKGRMITPFAYKDKGSMAIIGRNQAVVDMPRGTHFRGFFAWITWLLVHLISLQSGKNKFTTLYNWIVSYFTRDQSLRMIIRKNMNP